MKKSRLIILIFIITTGVLFYSSVWAANLKPIEIHQITTIQNTLQTAVPTILLEISGLMQLVLTEITTMMETGRRINGRYRIGLPMK